MDFYLDPEFWVAVAFIIVVGMIFKPAVKALTSALDDRASRIRVQIEEARKLVARMDRS